MGPLDLVPDLPSDLVLRAPSIALGRLAPSVTTKGGGHAFDVSAALADATVGPWKGRSIPVVVLRPIVRIPWDRDDLERAVATWRGGAAPTVELCSEPEPQPLPDDAWKVTLDAIIDATLAIPDEDPLADAKVRRQAESTARTALATIAREQPWALAFPSLHPAFGGLILESLDTPTLEAAGHAIRTLLWDPAVKRREGHPLVAVAPPAPRVDLALFARERDLVASTEEAARFASLVVTSKRPTVDPRDEQKLLDAMKAWTRQRNRNPPRAVVVPDLEVHHSALPPRASVREQDERLVGWLRSPRATQLLDLIARCERHRYDFRGLGGGPLETFADQVHEPFARRADGTTRFAPDERTEPGAIL